MKPCEYGCGTPVTFVLMGYTEERKHIWSLPMESLTREVKRKRAKSFEYADIVVTERFTLHRCTLGDEAKEKRRLREQANFAMRRDRARVTEEAWTEALKYDCPKCGVHSNVRCTNLTSRRLGREPQETRHPHAERLPEGWPDV